MDQELAKIVEGALKIPNPLCPDCGVEGVVRGWGEIAWCECPKCGKKIGEMTIL